MIPVMSTLQIGWVTLNKVTAEHRLTPLDGVLKAISLLPIFVTLPSPRYPRRV